MTENFSETDVNARETLDAKKPKRFRKTKIFLLTLLILICLKVGHYYCFDRPTKALNAVAVVEPNVYSPDVHYKTVYDDAQTQEFLPAKENGFREILAALGPKCLKQNQAVRTIPWEEFPTNEGSKSWFEGTWVPLCEIFELDPNAKPTMLDRLPFMDYLVKNGVTGEETSPDAGTLASEPSSEPSGGRTYWENHQELRGVIGTDEAYEVYDRLMSSPWTAEEFPVAAQWIEENDDYYELISQAVRKPKFGCWHFVPDGPLWAMLLPDVQHLCEFARMLSLRANYRLGEGDVSGALDDVESMTLITDSVLRDENAVMIQSLVAIAVGSIALAVPLEDADGASATVEECQRVVEIFAKYTQDEKSRQLVDQSMKMEKFFALNTVSILLEERRQGKAKFSDLLDDRRQDKASKARFLLPLLAPPINDDKVLCRVNELWEKYLDDETRPEVETIFGKRKNYVDFFQMPPMYWAGSKGLADSFAALLIPATSAFETAVRRFETAARLKQVAAAILAYEADHGTFPPAFSVDAAGQPLLSWRVLILPYLGDEAKALYEEFALDEPWDSEHNQTLLTKIPNVYRRFGDAEPDMTRVAVLLGEESFFDDSGVGKKRDEVTLAEGGNPDDLALFMTSATLVPWTSPDTTLDQSTLREALAESSLLKSEDSDGPLAFLGATYPGGDLYATGAGAVKFLPLHELGPLEPLEEPLYGKSLEDEE